jgi:hypothetical protein
MPLSPSKEKPLGPKPLLQKSLKEKGSNCEILSRNFSF